MGFFEDVGAFTYGIGEGIAGFFGDVKDTVIDLIHAPKEIITHVVDKGSELVQAVGSDIKDTVVGASKEVGGALSNVGASFSWPLAAAAAVVAIVVLSKK